MSDPQIISLDGDDWTVYWVPPGEWRERNVREQPPPAAEKRRLTVSVPEAALDALLPDALWGPDSEPPGPNLDPSWVYEKAFRLPPGMDGLTLRLRLERIDGDAHVFLNGEPVGRHAESFVPVEWDVTRLLRPGEENQLLVVLERRHVLLQGRIGIPDSVSLVAVGRGWMRSVAVHSHLSLDRTEAALSIVSELSARVETQAVIAAEVLLDGLPAAAVEDPVRLFPRETAIVQSVIVRRVQLWWPNGYGPQPLYEARISLLDAAGRLMDRRVVPFAIRQVEALPCDGAPPDSLPYSLAVNGRRIWLKGGNWPTRMPLYREPSQAQYGRLIEPAADAHVNLLRVGNGMLERDDFYRFCDRHGIMVWQEFPFGVLGPLVPGDRPATEPDSLDAVRERAEAIILRRRHHPCLVIWSGAGMLTEDAPEPAGSDHPVLAELRAAVETEDPGRLWLPTSPSGPCYEPDPARKGELHDVHGPWSFLGLREHPRFYNEIDPLLHGALACPVDRTASEGAFGAVGLERSAGEALEAIGLQYAVEANRRRKWRCAGTLPWLDDAAHPNPAYYAVKRAYAPFHVSARFETFAWEGAPRFEADIWLHNSDGERTLLNVVATVVDLEGRELYQENLSGEAPENSAENVGDLSWSFPPGFADAFLLFLEVIDEEGETLARNAYLHSRAPEPAFAPFLRAPQTALELERVEGGVLLRNRGPVPALWVSLEAGEALVEDSAFPMAPGAARALRLSDPAAAVRAAAWNAAEVRLSGEG